MLRKILLAAAGLQQVDGNADDGANDTTENGGNGDRRRVPRGAGDVTAGSFEGCVRSHDTSHLDPELDEEKVFCPGIGNVFVVETKFDVQLTEYSIP